jgi:adenylate cyclase
MTKHVRTLVIGIILTILFLFSEKYISPAKLISLKIYDILNRIEYRLHKPPSQIKDIVIVSIDNETIGKMPYRWPYPRSIFASAIKNLMLAQAKVIAFDFVFLGKSEEIEDQALREALSDNDKIILASTIDENGALNIRSLPSLAVNVPSGIVTKLQDIDGEIRRNLTYLISDEIPPKGFLSWEMAILKSVEGLTVTPIKGDECYLSIKNDEGEKWLIPVDCYNKSFMINFLAHTGDFKRIPLYNAYTGNFDPSAVKDKIVLVGFVSSLLGDIHNTPIGWMPGIILNANSFLTLYTHSFIKDVPVRLDRFLAIIGVLLSTMILLLFDKKTAGIFIAAQIAVFFIISYALLTMGYMWDYFAFPFSVAVFPALSTHIYAWIWQRKKFYWT